ncbi:MAG: restriction endonuclease [Candidatus Coatesbacteria bacterium]|nr:restriction endonuclease [Candidatus Coatesbacteria bacterium]
MNKLYYGDCLDVLRDHIPDESIDLIYIDPPFNSKRNYNVIYDGAMAQAEAFKDTWSLTNLQEEKTLIFKKEPQRYQALHNVIDSFEKMLINSEPSLLGYLINMSIRLVELRRVLKDTGSIYLHCDPTASHYLKILMDEIFGRKNFRNEIVWCYKTRQFSKKYWNRKHDDILFYSKSKKYPFYYKRVLNPLSESTIKKYKLIDETGRRYRLEGRGIQGSPIRSQKDVNEKWEKTNPELTIRDYLKDGYPPEDYWNINIINQAAKERLGYATQKPLELLERIINASCPEKGIVLDAFCGCGTTVAAAKKLNRHFIGVDITYLAIDLIKKRLIDTFYKDEKKFNKDVEIFGIPKDLEGARVLAKETKNDRVRKEFEKWAVFKANGIYTEKKGADYGLDGYLFLWDAGETKIKGVIQVKSGKVGVHQIRDFSHTIDREGASFGFFITLEEPTKNMFEEINKLPKVISKMGRGFDKIYIITVQDLLDEKLPSLPFGRMVKKAERIKQEEDNNIDMFE